jgi:hypothetical protein
MTSLKRPWLKTLPPSHIQALHKSTGAQRRHV